VPHALFIAGAAVVCSAVCSIFLLYIVFNVRDSARRNQLHSPPGAALGDQHKIPMEDIGHGQGHSSTDSAVRHSSQDQGEYMFGLEYSNEGPPLMYRTQGMRKSDKPNDLFPGYKLGKQNLRGHDRKWWTEVTFASVPYL